MKCISTAKRWLMPIAIGAMTGMSAFADNGSAVVELYTGLGVEERDLGASTAYIFTDTTEAGSITISEPGYAELLIVGGGGAGGSTIGGGGGAGGLVHYERQYLEAGTYPITVGAGGLPNTTGGSAGGNGGDSSFGSFVALGGGGGGTYSFDRTISQGRNGGSGGGSCCGCDGYGTGLNGQGHDGTGAYGDSSGGGGGAGEAGGETVSTDIWHNDWDGTSGKGGDGLLFDIAGEMKWYAGGGGGGAGRSWNFNMWASSGGEGGKGGGGNGANRNTNLAGSDGVPGTGGGAGGGCHEPQTIGGVGGSGVVVLKVCTADLTDAIPDIELRGITLTNGVHSATFDYRILSLGGYDALDVVLEYGTDINHLISTADMGSVTATGEYTAQLENFSEDTEYHGRFALLNSGNVIARSCAVTFRMEREKEMPEVVESKRGLWEVLIEGDTPDYKTDILSIGPGTKATERHQAECPEMFYTTGSYENAFTGETYSWPMHVGATWCYSGYVYLHTAGEWGIVFQQKGYVYVAIDGRQIEDWRVAGELRVVNWICPKPGWYKFDVRTSRSDQGGGFHEWYYAFQWEQNNAWEWKQFTKDMLRLDFDDPIVVNAVSYINGVYNFDCSAVPEAGDELMIRYGTLADGTGWQTEKLSDSSLALLEGEANYYQIFGTDGSKEYSSIVMAFNDARRIDASIPEATVTGIENVGSSSATIDINVLSCGAADVAKGVISFGVSERKLTETIETDEMDVGSHPFTLTNLAPSTTYYFTLHFEAEGGACSEESKSFSFTTADDPTYVAAGERPKFADGFSVDGTGGDQLVINATLAYDAGDEVEVFAEFSTADDMSDSLVQQIGCFRAADAITETICGMRPGTRYYVRLLGYSASGRGCATTKVSIMTAGEAKFYAPAPNSRLYQANYSITVTDIGVGGRAMINFIVDDEVVETREATGPNDYAFTYVHYTFGEHTYRFVLENTCAGGTGVSASTAKTSYKLRQNTTYSWIGDVDGAWSDSANWYCQEAIGQGRDCGYPDSEEVLVDFSRVTSKARVTVDGNYTVCTISPCAENVEVVLAGSDTTGLTIIRRVDGEQLYLSNGSRLVFDDGSLTTYDEFVVPAGCTYVLTNTCSAGVFVNGCVTVRENNSALELYDSSIYQHNALQVYGNNTRVLIHNSTINCNQVRFPISAEDRDNEIRISGAGSVLSMNQNFHVGDVGENDGSSRIIFDVPVGGYNVVPIIGVNPDSCFNAENHALGIVIGRDSPMFGARKLENEVLLDFAGGSINNAKIALSSERSKNMIDFAYLYAGDATEPPTEGVLPLKLAVSCHSSGLMVIVR